MFRGQTRSGARWRFLWSQWLAFVLANVVCSSASTEEPSTQPACATAQECLDLIPKFTKKGKGISKSETALAKKLQSFEAESIPGLLVLLSDPDPDTRYFAAYAVRNIEGLEPDHVAPILQAAMKQNAGGWLPPALARIGTPEAVAGLVVLLRKYPQTNTQITFAFEQLGARSIPALLPLLDEDGTGEDLFLAVGHIFAELGPESQDAALPLAKIVADPTRPQKVRLQTVGLLGRMGPAADPARDNLIGLLSRVDGDMQWAVAGALFDIGGAGLGDIYAVILAPPEVPFDGVVTNELEQLGFGDYVARLTRIASLGERARDAVPAVLKLLYDPNPSIRVNAARTLGFIADESIGPHLVAFINDDDWLMVRVVTESLGRVRYESARSEVSLVARGHWYPPVRTIASDVLAALDGEHKYEPIDRSRNFYFDYDPKRFSFPTPKACATTQNTPRKQSGGERFSADRSPELAKQFAYQYEAHTYSDDGSPEVRVMSQPAQIGLRGPKGWFLGSSRGEWGGELIWRPDGGADQTIVRDNIEDVYELSPEQYVATAGLAHLTLDSGQIYKLERSQEKWLARWWLRLPGMPVSSWTTKDGGIVINTTGGSVVLDREGTLRMADCTASSANGQRVIDLVKKTFGK